jgi:hypothetical protein
MAVLHTSMTAWCPARQILLVLLLVWARPGQADEWMSCASRTHTIDLLVDAHQPQVLSFALFIHHELQDAVSWDMVTRRVDPRAHTLTLLARERSTAPREFTLTVDESTGRYRSRGPHFELELDLTCSWGRIGD